MSAVDRAARTEAADALCAAAYAAADGPWSGVALVAVGGYGRGELAPCSDLDVVLVHDDDLPAGVLDPVLERIWYPLWDSGSRVDHSVRSLSEMTSAAADDLKVMLGQLDVRHLAGDHHLSLRLRTEQLAHWRRDARRRLPELKALTHARHVRAGELAHASVPDLKESHGGLRDATVLRALVASWLVDASQADSESVRRGLLDARDELHAVTGRAVDRVAPEHWAALAERLGEPDAVAAQRHVRELGRRLTHFSRLAWRRVDAVLAGPAGRGPRRPRLEVLAPGVALSGGEVVLARGARPEDDPALLLRACAEAAERDVPLAPATAARLARDGAPLPDPWPAEARRLLVRTLAAGPGLLPVWETLEETGALSAVLPEWERIRLFPHASAVHRFTVDRHSVETCVEASGLIRTVGRPDVLAVAALLHDIGKGGVGDHSVEGEPVARRVARRLGFDDDECDVVGTLVRQHLLLAQTATSRDPDDPVTLAHVADRVGTPEVLSLLVALTEADAKAASAQAWSSWRAGLVRRLADGVLAVLLAREAGTSAPRVADPEVAVPDAVRADPARAAFTVEVVPDGARVTAVSGDRVGLLADVAAVLALQRVRVRAARAWSQDSWGVSAWDVSEEVDPAVLRDRFAALVEGRLDVGRRLRLEGAPGELPPSVEVHHEASRTSTVLEVRASDRLSVVHHVCSTLARLDIAVRSAHVDTLGPQAVDVFYLQEAWAGALADDRAADAAHAVRSALAGAG